MPPKRKSTGSNGQASKKTKNDPAAPPATPKYEPPSSGRILIHHALFPLVYRVRDEDEEDDDEDDDDGDSEDGDSSDEDEGDGDERDVDGLKRQGPTCGKKHCKCFKPVAANPEHPWVISWAGFKKFRNQFIHNFVRDPEHFGMYMYNDFAAYGSLEVLENLLLDFEEAEKEQRGGWREQWAVCEAAVHWLLHGTGQAFCMADDGEKVQEAARLVGRMFLTMLAQLDEQGLVGDATAVQSLGCTMAMYMELASAWRAQSVLEEDDRKSYNKKLKFQPDYFEDAVLTYANKRGVTLQGPKDIEELMAQAVGDIELPEKGAKDPWGWNAALKTFTKNHGASYSARSARKIGGDHHDVTTLSSAERKAASFTKKDPFSKKDLENIKNGMILSPA
ncbi:hypothetical protein NPX13_g7410 [Xylaria arbuscula]|uniref:Uncharacterized protein n=1 Tax=Xylaria arbuscula TaxID=114810 RepID=A0A9W8TKT8_9PEZI|nr:hypothetical protein NPX13_g7410 [Xylaria arbuscula]